MENIVFYRKYRPKSFADIKNQDIIVTTLKNSIVTKNLSHSYIFSGPRGTGKTSLAKIFAKAINCLNSKGGDNCNECSSCKIIDEQKTIDVIELDAASNNGVNDVRNIIDNIKYFTVDLNFKVYIIDEAHMLTTPAWNAFLKSLEDPPKNLIFIFATTEPYKIPSTILSRCQRYNFARINETEMINHLNKICELENVETNWETLKKIAHLADGSLRDGLSILDQMSSYGNKSINLIDLNKVFGLTDISQKTLLLQNIMELKIDALLNMIENLDSIGIDFYQLTIEIIEILFDKLIYEKTKDASLLKNLNYEHVNFIDLQPKFLVKWIEVWQHSLKDIKTNTSKKFFFELAALNSTKLFDFDFKIENKESEKYIETLKKVKTKEETDSNFVPQETKQKEAVKEVFVDKQKEDLETIANSVQNVLKNIDTSFINTYEISPELFSNKDYLGVNSEKFLKLKEKHSFNNPVLLSAKEIEKIVDSAPDEQVVKNETAAPEKAKETQQERLNKKDDEAIFLGDINEGSLFDIEDSTETSTEPKDKAIVEEKNEQPQKEKNNKVKVEEKIDTKEKPLDDNKEDLATLFNQIAFNKNNSEKDRIEKLYQNIKTNVPLSKEEGYLIDGEKVILASNNGIIILFNDVMNANNFNEITETFEFLSFIADKFGRAFKVFALTKEQIIEFTEVYKQNVAKKIKFSDINIEGILKTLNSSRKSNKDLALEILGDLVEEEE